MASTLDLTAARVVFLARQFERAVNDPGPWEMSFHGHRVPASRVVREHSVVFWAHFPDACWLDGGDLSLLCGGELHGSRPVEQPEDGQFRVTWEIGLPSALVGS